MGKRIEWERSDHYSPLGIGIREEISRRMMLKEEWKRDDPYKTLNIGGERELTPKEFREWYAKNILPYYKTAKVEIPALIRDIEIYEYIEDEDLVDMWRDLIEPENFPEDLIKKLIEKRNYFEKREYSLGLSFRAEFGLAEFESLFGDTDLCLDEGLREKETYGETKWATRIGDRDVTITIHQVQNYLKEKEVPVVRIRVKEIEDMCIHRDKKDKKTLQRAQRSNLKYPIIIAKGKDGGWTMILDGHHRLKKAIEEGRKGIKAKILDLKYAPPSWKIMFG